MEETMRKTLFVLVVIVGLITTVVAQKEKTGSLGGIVRSSERSVIEKARITLTHSNQNVETQYTDAKGKYRFNGLPEGFYELSFEADDHLVGKKRVRVKADHHSICNVVLTSTATVASRESEQLSTQAPSHLPQTTILSDAGGATYGRRPPSHHPGPGAAGSATGSSGSVRVREHTPAFRDFVSRPEDYAHYPQQHETSEYSNLQENIFHSPLDKALSTFSIDVDTAYYAQMRNALFSGRMLPPNSVRIEEMINYFSYDYPAPKSGEVFSVYTELGENPWNKERQLLHIGLRGKDVDLSKAPPSNLVFLVDVSGSMNQANKLPLVKQSLNILLDQMRPDDKIAVVVYAGSSGLAVPPTNGRNKEQIRAAIDRLQAGGSTAGAAGIQLAYKTAVENYVKGGSNRVILCTDGDFNVGTSNTAELVSMVETQAKKDVYLTVLGFGMGNFKDSRMEEITNKGNGNYAYIDTIAEARKVLSEEMAGTLFTIAKDVKIQVEFNPSKVKAYRLIGYVNRNLRAEDFKDDAKDAGELGSGHTVTAIYEIMPVHSKEDIAELDDLKYQKKNIKESPELATVKLRYKMPDSDTSIPREFVVAAKARTAKECSSNFMFAAAVAGFGMLLSESDFTENLDLEKIRKLAATHMETKDAERRREFVSIVDKYARTKGIGINKNYWD
jgi:Ca-activated chloride channel family protein